MPSSTSRFAVVCAAHGGNSGMHSVDLSAVRFFSERGAEFTLFAAHPQASMKSPLDGHRVQIITDPGAFADYTHVVYWGDFLNNPAYGRGVFSWRHKQLGLVPKLGAGQDYWRRIFLLEDAPQVNAAAFSLGGNFQHDWPRHMRPALARLAERFSAILPRDAFSTHNLSRVMPFDALTRVRQGMDMAFLLRPPQDKPAADDHFCWFFGRSGLKETDELVAAVARATGLRPHPLGDWLKMPAGGADEAFEQSRAAIASARFVLTDTYHLLINTMTLGVPVIPIARRSPKQQGTLGDFKKFTLFEMLDLSHRVIDIPEDAEAADPARIVAAATEIATRPETRADDYRLMRALADKFRGDVGRLLFEAAA